MFLKLNWNNKVKRYSLPSLKKQYVFIDLESSIKQQLLFIITENFALLTASEIEVYAAKDLQPLINGSIITRKMMSMIKPRHATA